jgi:hypothetical protein
MTTRSIHRHSLKALVAFLAIAFLAAGPAISADRWFHVSVQEDSGAEVNVNLPLNLIESVIRLLPDDLENEVRVELNDEGFDIDELRNLWDEVRTSQDATYMTVKDGDEEISIRKAGNFLIAETTSRGAHDAEIDMRFPLEVVDALFSGPNNTLDLAAAVRALADYGDGDIVTVRDSNSLVRIWVDDNN